MKKFSKNQIISLCVGSILAATVVSIAGVVITQAVKGEGIFGDRRVDIAFESGSNKLAYGETDIIKASVKNVQGNCEWHFTIEDQSLHYVGTILKETHDGIQINSYGKHNEEITFTNNSNQKNPVDIVDIYAVVGDETSEESIQITALPALIK